MRPPAVTNVRVSDMVYSLIGGSNDERRNLFTKDLTDQLISRGRAALGIKIPRLGTFVGFVGTPRYVF